MFPKPPRPEPPRKAVATMVVQQRVTGAVDTNVIVVPAPATGSGVLHPADVAGVQALDVKPVGGF